MKTIVSGVINYSDLDVKSSKISVCVCVCACAIPWRAAAVFVSWGGGAAAGHLV